jgi:hypothetical protein
MTLSAAIHKADPPITVEREPLPMPKATRSVSPSMDDGRVEPEPLVEHLLKSGLVALALVLAAINRVALPARVKSDLGRIPAGGVRANRRAVH